MQVSLSDLLTPAPWESWMSRLLSELLARVDSNGVPYYTLTDFEPGGVARTLLEVDAEALSDLDGTVLNIAAGGFTDSAVGPWLDLVASSFFSLERHESTFAVDRITLTCDPLLGPYEIAAGQLWVSSASGLLFNSLEAGVIISGGTLTLSARAEQAGSAYNLPRNTLTRLATPLPGVTVTNPVTGLRQAGSDLESDDSLRRRCFVRWGELGQGPRDAYESWARLFPSVTKVSVLDQHPRGQGSVDVVLWGDGGIGADTVPIVRDYILARKPMTSDVQVYAATERPIIVKADIRYPRAREVEAQAAVTASLSNLARVQGIGTMLYRSSIVEALFVGSGGVVDANVVAPLSDIILFPIEVVTFIFQPNWIPQ